MITVLSLDPGDTTGVALATIHADVTLITPWQKPYSEGQLRDMLAYYTPKYLICESFEYRNKSRSGLVLTSRNLIGVVNLYQYDNPDCRVFMQSPAAGKAFFSNDVLKRMELYSVGLNHGRDAVRHFLRWYKFGYGAQYNIGQPINLAGA